MKLVIVLLCISLYSNVHSQNPPIRYKGKITSYQTVFNDKYGDYSIATQWRDTSFIFVIEPADKKVTFYGDKISVFDFTNEGEVYTNESEKSWKWIKWKPCLDKDGTRCDIRISIYNGSDESLFKRAYLYIDYLNKVYVYYVNFN